jgi:hypothetical protein
MPPLRWKEGDDAGNIRSLIQVSVDSLANNIQQLRDARFDLESGTFRTGEGKPLSDELIEGWAASPSARMAGAGVRTLKRGALLNTVVRERGEGGPGLLDQIPRVADQLVAEEGSLYRTFY